MNHFVDFNTPPAWEFYDLRKDAHEMDNRYGDPAYQEVIADLKVRLKRLRKELGEEDGSYPQIQKIIYENWNE